MLRNNDERPQNRPWPLQLARANNVPAHRATQVRFISVRWRGIATHYPGKGKNSPSSTVLGPVQLSAFTGPGLALQSKELLNSSFTSAALKGTKPTWLNSGRCSALKCVLIP